MAMASLWRIGARFLYVNLRSAVGRGIFVTGNFDQEVFEPWRASIKQRAVFVDVGPNVGYYTFCAVDYVGGDWAIHALKSPLFRFSV